jgi:tetratricopeptide (TPR) repeat protein
MGIQAGFNSNVFLGTTNGGPYGGKNCLHDNSSFEISAGYGCTIYAHNTWWNKPAPTYLPNASDFSLSSSTVYYSPTNLTSDPNGCSLSKTVNSLNKNIIAGNGSSFFDAEMDRIFTLPLEGKYEEAITVCKQIFEREKNTNKGRYALCKLKECLVQVNRKSDFEDFLNRSVKTVVTSKDELYALAIDFQNQTLFDNKDYSAIIKNMNDILKDYQNNVEIKKRTLFEIGLMYLQNMYDPAKAKKYFSQLEASFPKDPLVIYAKYLNGEDVPNNIKGSQDNQDSSVVSLNQTSKKFFLFDNYPNPFNPETVIKYSLPQNSKVVLEIFNILGEKVITLVDEIKSAGYHEAVFNGNNLSSGIYIYRLMAISNESGERFVKASKMIMLK